MDSDIEAIIGFILCSLIIFGVWKLVEIVIWVVNDYSTLVIIK